MPQDHKGREVTVWFPPSRRPIRDGIYEVELSAFAKEMGFKVFYRKFFKGTWYLGATSPAQAALSNVKARQNLRCWRGLVSPLTDSPKA